MQLPINISYLCNKYVYLNLGKVYSFGLSSQDRKFCNNKETKKKLILNEL